MRSENNRVLYSATDLANFLGCKHATELERAVAEGRLEKNHRADPMLELLVALGERHERRYIEHLKTLGKSVVELEKFSDPDGRKTLEAMRTGADAIVQGRLADVPWGGYPDFLLKIERASKLGAWSYEVADTKLSATTKATAVLQLCLYTELLTHIQGVQPEFMHVIKPERTVDGEPFNVDRLRVDDFMAYYRMAKRSFEAKIASDPDINSKPEPCNHCQICRWWPKCDREWHDTDHLSLIASISKSQRVELVEQGITSLTEFAEAQQPLQAHPKRGSLDAYHRIHRQAQIQLKGRQTGKPEYEFNEIDKDRGFLLLPEPNAGDVFFDLEGNPHAPGGVLEYLFGLVAREGTGTTYHYAWCLDRVAEQRAFCDLMEFLLARWEAYPEFHIYHYAPYEPSAMKRLAMRYAQYESELDRFLRAEKFIDLYAVTRQSMSLSVERYSIKNLEVFYGFERLQKLETVRPAQNAIERAIDLEATDEISDDDQKVVRNYNEDDCVSTLQLQSWLEERRTEFCSRGVNVQRPERRYGEAPPTVALEEDARARMFARLTAEIDEEPQTNEQRARWVLAHLLDYFRREEKCVWWEYFRRHNLEPEELLHEKTAITGLSFETQVPGGARDRNPTHRYRFELQELSVEAGDTLVEVLGDEVGTVASIDPVDGILDIKKNGKAVDIHPVSVFSHELIRAKPMPESLISFGNLVIANLDDLSMLKSARMDLLAKRAPRLRTLSLPIKGQDITDVAMQIASDLDSSILPIQGPPGAGKTFLGSHMIAELAKAGKHVGVTAISHKVIGNLLKKTEERLRNTSIVLAHRTSERPDDYPAAIEMLKNTDAAVAAVNAGKIVGGTAWLWSADQLEQQLDYLFIDEAGQMSLAIALAACRAAKNVILLGDPQQLEQPQLGSHPEGTEVAALNHLLDGRATIPDDRGIFMDRTWRLSPNVCRFTSEQFYDGRLQSRDGLEQQSISGSSEFAGSGLVYVPVEHEGNQNRSDEEIAAIETILATLLQTRHRWTDSEGIQHELTSDDILIVAPYNAQVNAMKRAFGDSIKVGTVDKFQGQEAPIVIYSTASSSVDDAPRGMSFLYNPNRLNVATSRAKCLAIIVGSPKLFEPECRTPEQIALANGFCRFLELASTSR